MPGQTKHSKKELKTQALEFNLAARFFLVSFNKRDASV